MLKTPLIPVGFSGKYPTKTGALIMPGIRGKFNFEKGLLFFSCPVAWFVVTEIKFCFYSTFTFVQLYVGFIKVSCNKFQPIRTMNDAFSRLFKRLHCHGSHYFTTRSDWFVLSVAVR